MRPFTLLPLVLVLTPWAAAQADTEAPADPDAVVMGEAMIEAYIDSLAAGLQWQQGEVVLDGGIATLRIPEAYRFLGSADAETVLTAWGNPPGTGALGMLFPATAGPFDEDSWGVVVTFQEDGYVSDEDAADIDYDDLLAQMKDDMEIENEARAQEGYETIDLLGWAEAPHYDAASKKLFWAKDLRFEGAEGTTLNYDVRLLGRRGVLSFNAVAATGQLGEVRAGMAEVMTFSDFNEGHRYTDFNPDVDKVAAYGIGALIAGKVAAKAGLLKGLLILLAKGWKVVLVAGAGVAAFLRRRFGAGGEAA